MKAQGDNFDASWRKRCTVSPISRAQGEPFIRAHYLGKWPGVCVLTLGMFVDAWLQGCIVFALPPRETAKRYGGETWELARLFIDDSVPRNAETWLIAQAVKWIKSRRSEVRYLVSYADPSAGHLGVIYRAANWKQDGHTDQERKTPRFDYAANGKTYSRRSHVPESEVNRLVKVPRVSKARFYLALVKGGFK